MNKAFSTHVVKDINPDGSEVIGHCTSNMVAHIMNLAKNL
jgi:hypothetical protein